MSQNGHTPESDRVRLDSWKEIAEYLKRDVRTVLRWERDRGLPVHTVPSGRRRSVYAWKDELDEWMAGSTGPDENKDTDSPEPAASNRSRLNLFAHPVKLTVAAAALLLIIAFFGANSLRSTSEAPLTSVTIVSNVLHVLQEDGAEAWWYEFKGLERQLTNYRIVPEGKVIADGCKVFAVARLMDRGNSPNLEPVASKLHCFSASGALLWEKELAERLRFGDKEYGTLWGFRALHLFEVNGQQRMAASLVDYTWWPSLVVVYDFEGNITHRFVNAGWLSGLTTVQNRSGAYLLAGGVSNSNDGGVMAVLGANNPTGTSPEKPGSEFECHNCPAGRPFRYFVFPRSELNLLTGAELNTSGPAVLKTGIEVHTTEGALDRDGVSAVYEFSMDFELLSASYDDRYWGLHRRLELEGKLKHSRANCPERDGPRFVRMWDAANGWREIQPASRRTIAKN